MELFSRPLPALGPSPTIAASVLDACWSGRIASILDDVLTHLKLKAVPLGAATNVNISDYIGAVHYHQAEGPETLCRYSEKEGVFVFRG